MVFLFMCPGNYSVTQLFWLEGRASIVSMDSKSIMPEGMFTGRTLNINALDI